MNSVGDIMSTPMNVQYTGVSIWIQFNCFPHIYHDIPQCTEHPPSVLHRHNVGWFLFCQRIQLDMFDLCAFPPLPPIPDGGRPMEFLYLKKESVISITRQMLLTSFSSYNGFWYDTEWIITVIKLHFAWNCPGFAILTVGNYFVLITVRWVVK